MYFHRDYLAKHNYCIKRLIDFQSLHTLKELALLDFRLYVKYTLIKKQDVIHCRTRFLWHTV